MAPKGHFNFPKPPLCSFVNFVVFGCFEILSCAEMARKATLPHLTLPLLAFLVFFFFGCLELFSTGPGSAGRSFLTSLLIWGL